MIEYVRSEYNEIAVQRSGRGIDLEVAGATFASWHPTHYLTGYSWDAITGACLLHADGPPRSVLLLGLGGGTVTRQLRLLLPDAELTGVEIDPEVVRLARRYMELDRQGVEVIEADGYAFLEETPRRFDVIIDDIYRTGPLDVERPATLGAALLARLAACLNPGGLVAANFITDGPHELERRAALRVFDRRFAQIAVVRPPKGFNAILVGGERLAPVATVRSWARQFPRRRDRELWKRLQADASG